ncbi:MAG: hypothetical protein VKJ85_15530 [Prochlorothrix sp.]|nr:hypothetical protein [Prochlorothrix sp.]
MGTPSVEPFTDNWSYIKTELNWLERLLMVAVGQQRRDWQETLGLAQNERDKVTRHWWKGIISLNQTPNYDEKRPTPPAKSENQGFQQQLAQRIQSSQQQGVILSLPSLQHRLQLTNFEKNVVLMGLAPEVNRRYIRLFNYLQGEDRDRPLVDLALKLLCRNDQDWQVARSRLTTHSPLVERGLLQFRGPEEQPLLLRSLYLPEYFVNFLLTQQVQHAQLDSLLGIAPNANPIPLPLPSPGMAQLSIASNPSAPPSPGPSSVPHPFPGTAPSPDPFATPVPGPVPNPTPSPAPSRSTIHGDPWLPLVLPPALHQRLKTLGQRYVQNPAPPYTSSNPASNHTPNHTPYYAQTPNPNSTSQHTPAIDRVIQAPVGDILLWTGPSGTGKTLAAQTLALVLTTPLCQVDLSTQDIDRTLALLDELAIQPPPILVLEPAPLWLGWRSPLASAPLKAFLDQRCQQGFLTIFEGQRPFPLAWIWEQRISQPWTFPRPDTLAREQIWRQIFPLTIALDPALPWSDIAQRWEITGGDIATIARMAQTLAQSRGLAITVALLEEARTLVSGNPI